METLHFKNIPNWWGYQVTNYGEVVSNKGRKRRFLKQYTTKKGYKSVTLSRNGKTRTVQVHQLVAMAFLGHKPDGHKKVVDHIDGNPSNNNVRNLALTSNRHNCSKDKRNGTSKYTGVSFDKSRGKWIACIWISGKQKTLGRFDCETKAHLAYQAELNQ